MPSVSRFIIFLLVSLALHTLVILGVVLINRKYGIGLETTPVRIVRLPPEALKKLPPLDRPLTRRDIRPERFGTDEEIKLPRTAPPSQTEGATGTGAQAPSKEKGPLPFLSQRDIDELAKKGMPPRRPGDDSVTLDTDEFKFISYNRWLKIRVESRLRYPELAAVSGIQGVLYIRFDILKDGSLGSVEVLKSSGYKILDDEAVRAITASAPFQPLPDEWNMQRYPIRAAVIFYINEAYVR